MLNPCCHALVSPKPRNLAKERQQKLSFMASLQLQSKGGFFCDNTAITMAGTQPNHNSVVPPSSTKKRAPVFVPKMIAKKRKASRRTHSPKTTAISPCSVVNVPRTTRTSSKLVPVPPTVEGIEQGARVMCSGSSKRRLAIPTETVYMICSALKLEQNGGELDGRNDNFTSTSIGRGPPHPTLVLESAQQLDSILKLPKSPYAIRLPNGKATPVVRLNETSSVLQKLATKYWPGPLSIYVCVNETECKIPSGLLRTMPSTNADNDFTAPDDTPARCKYLPLACPSHPLLGRVLAEVSTKHHQAVVGIPTAHTSAQDIVDHYRQNDDSTEMHIVLGEDQRELFHVPTCQYGRTCGVSLWINSKSRRVYIVGSKSENMVQVSPQFIQDALLKLSNPNNVEQRVTCAVLKKWTVLDQRVDEKNKK